MHKLYLLPLILLLKVNGSTQEKNTLAPKVEPYDYPTKLKGGYKIQFKIKKDIEYLYLRKGNKTICELSSMSVGGGPYKNLGYEVDDFQHFFVFAQSYGSGNPNYIELIKKSTGKNILEKDAAWIDHIESRNILLYSVKSVPSPKDKMALYNVETGKKEFFNFPKEVFVEPDVLNHIHIDKLTDKLLIIKYDANGLDKKKIYHR